MEKHEFNPEFPWFDETLGNVDPRLGHMHFVNAGLHSTFVSDIKINILNVCES